MKMMIVAGVVVSIFAVGGLAKAQGTVKESPAIQKHVEAARELAGTRYKAAMERLCSPPDRRSRPTFTDLALEPVRLFELTNHSYVDDSLPIIDSIRKRKQTEPNAYLIGEEGFQRFSGWQAECLKADIARSEK